MVDLWHLVVSIHRGGWQQLIVFYGVVGALVVFVCLELLHARSRRLARRALKAAREAMDEARALATQLGEIERRLQARLDEWAGDLDARTTKKIDRKGDLMQQRIDERSAALSDSISKLDARVSRAEEQVARFRERVDEVEDRIPNLFDRLDEFRGTLARTFQGELSSVLNSFDNSVAAILQQMKSELQLGISRIESIESMVRSRERAEQGLLGFPSPASALPGAEREEQPGGDAEGFEEWEEQAKRLANDEDEGDSEAQLRAVPLEEAEAPEQYPAEMAEGPDEETGPGEEKPA